jgi:uncharacterized membrane protein
VIRVTSNALLLAFLIGVIDGLRSMTAPAIVAWAAHRGWLNLLNSSLSFMGSTAAVVVFTLGAVAELVADKLPSTPRRTERRGLIARCVLGGLSGAAVAASDARRSHWAPFLVRPVGSSARLRVTRFARTLCAR